MSPDRRTSLLLILALTALGAISPSEPDPPSLDTLRARLAASPLEDRIRLETLARRHAAWVQTLPEPRRRALQAAGPEDRLALIGRWRAEARRRRQAPGTIQAVLQVSALCPESIRRTAADLRVWFALDAARRRQILAASTEAEQLARFRAAIRGNRELARVREQARADLALDPADLRDPPVRRLERGRPAAAKAEQSRRLADWKTVRELGWPEVDPATLARFEDDLPPWTRRGLDPLPPDVARRRLALLHSLVFPPPGEAP